MKRIPLFNLKYFSGKLIALIAILLAFILMLFFIWLWYDIRIKKIEKEVSKEGQSINSKHETIFLIKNY